MKPLFNCFVLMLLSALCASCNRSHVGYDDERSPVDVSDIISMIESGKNYITILPRRGRYKWQYQQKD